MQILFLMQGKSYFKIFQGLTNNALFIHFLSFSLVCRCSYVAYIAFNTDPNQTASLVNISFHEQILLKKQALVHLNVLADNDLR